MGTCHQLRRLLTCLFGWFYFVQLAQAYTPVSNSSPFNKVKQTTSRRSVLVKSFGFLITTMTSATPPAARALDMDAFINQELSSSTCDEKTNKKCTPKLSEDEALCRFGQPSKETGEACIRAGMSTKRASRVDAFGTVDRGDYVRCKAKWVDDPTNSNKLVKEWQCK